MRIRQWQGREKTGSPAQPGEHRAARLPLGSALLLLTLAAGALGGCARKQAAGPTGPMPPLPVTVVRVQPTDVPLTGEWVGTLDGYVNAQIQPQVSGYIIRQTYREGSQVAKDQVLFEIDPRPFEAALQQAEGQLGQARGQMEQAQAQLGLAQINVNRDTPLAQAKAIAQSQLDNDRQQKAQAGALVQSAQAAISAAQAAVATAKLNLGFTHVRSLIGGVAGQALVQVGNLVGPQSVLTSVSQLNPIKVFFSISDSEYLALTQRAREGGGSLLNGAADIPLTLILANGATYPQRGRIVFVDRQMDAQTGAIRIAATFPNPGNVLRPGEFGRIRAETEVRHNVILVPQVAVQELQGLEQVYTVTPDNKVHVVNVKLGPQFQNDWIVDGGLPAGAMVVTDNVQKLREGAPVNPREAASPAAETFPANGPAGS